MSITISQRSIPQRSTVTANPVRTKTPSPSASPNRFKMVRCSCDVSRECSQQLIIQNISFIKCELQVDITSITSPSVVGVYFFNVQLETYTLTLQRRYTHFAFLDNFLKQLFPNIKLPHLPPKEILRSGSHPDVIHKRSKELSQYLQVVVQIPNILTHSIISDWFIQQPDESLVSFSKQMKTGYVLQESNVLKKWKKRYCVLSPNVLALFKCAKDLLMYEDPTTVICLTGCKVSPILDKGFNILGVSRSNDNLLYLKIEDDDEFLKWLTAIADSISIAPTTEKKSKKLHLKRLSHRKSSQRSGGPSPRSQVSSSISTSTTEKRYSRVYFSSVIELYQKEIFDIYQRFQKEMNKLYPSLLEECNQTEFPHLEFFEELKNLDESNFFNDDLEKYYQQLLVISKEYNTYVSIQKVTWMFINLYKYYKHFVVNGDSKLQSLQNCYHCSSPRVISSKQLVCRLCEHSYDLSHFSEHTKVCELIVRGCVEETTCFHRIKLVTNYLKGSYTCGMISDDFHYTQLIEMIPDFDAPIVIEKLQKIADGMKTLCNLKILGSFISVLAHKGKQNVILDAPSSAATLDDFDIIKKFSAGAYSRIYLVKKKSTGDVYAMKVMKKEDMIRKNVVDSVLVEKNFLAKAHNISVVKLFYAFQDDTNLYLVMEYCSGGDLATLLEHVGCLDEHATKIYSAEICLSLHYIHNIGCIHKDVKPDNILINKFGHLVLTDFGLSSYGWVSKDSEGAQGLFCTPDYAAPELLISDSYSFASDYFALGCMIYEFLVGKPPFNAETPEMIFMNIRNGTYSWPDEIEVSNDCKDLISQLLSNDPHNRPSFDVIKTHPFFNDINWNRLFEEDREDIFVPELEDDNDTGYFEDDRDMKIVHMNKDDMLHGKVDTKQPQKHIFGNFDVRNIENLIEENKRSYMEELTKIEKENL
ncbi:non-specific serine/threonine protein kinase [Entamoeba marina]